MREFKFVENVRPYANPIRETVIETGKVRGVPGGNTICTVFKGIPYAKPPVGELRWKAPQPAEPWKGTRACVEFGPAGIQGDRSVQPYWGYNMYPTPYEVSEDCLYINVWTPAESTDEKLPVLFWTHGGANEGGFGHEEENDGEALARRGCILVTYNYRMSAFGFLAHPQLSKEDPNGVSGNYGFMDAVAALKWTRRNIAAFGGDPDNITIGGQSAGCMMTMCLTVSPLTKGDYAKIVYHSGVSTTSGVFGKKNLAEAERDGLTWMEKKGCKNIAEMRALSVEDVLSKIDERWRFTEIEDGYSLTGNYAEQIGGGEFPDVPVICSVTADEGRRVPGIRQIIGEGTRSFCEAQLKLGRKPAYAFRFSRYLPGDDEGAWHTSELFYLFGTIDRTWRPMTGYDYDLSKTMTDFWANFMKTGDPNGPGLPIWTPYTEENKMAFDLGTTNGMIDASKEPDPKQFF